MPVAPTIHNTLGALVISNTFVASLYGLTTLQTYVYYGQSSADSLIMKCLIAFLWILDTLHAVLTSHTVYTYAITNFGNVLALLKPTWSLVCYILVTAISDSVIRAIFCYRIRILSHGDRRLFWPNVISTMVLVVAEAVLIVKYFRTPTFQALKQIEWLLYFTLSVGVFADFLIAATLTLTLVRNFGEFQRTKSTVRTLVLYIVSTGILTSVCMLGCLIAYATAPETFLFIAFFFPMSKLLLNSLLATLNSRQALREHIAARYTLYTHK